MSTLVLLANTDMGPAMYMYPSNSPAKWRHVSLALDILADKLWWQAQQLQLH